jgi:protein involved in polysaccharide export with SLBB domain
MKNSEIDITLSYSKVITVNIVGEVYYPGSYSIPSINTAFNALVAARGPNQLGTVRNIYIKRDGVTVDSLDIYKFLFNPTVSRDIYMQDGDYLFVPPAGKIVEIKGEVNRPYKYEVKSGETIDDLIKYAGGYTTTAFSDVLTLNRIEYNSLKVYDVHKDHTSSTVINNGDIINVNAISNKLSNYVQVKGSIGATGYYEFVKGEKLLTLLNRAKCIDEKTFLDKVYVIRLNKDRTKKHITLNLGAIIKDSNHEDNIWMQEYDIVSVLSLDNFDEHFSVSIYGAVRSNGQFDFGDGMTLQDIILQAGGLEMSAEDSRIEISRVTNYDLFTKKVTPVRAIVKTIKVGKDLMLSEDAREFALHPLDQVFVRSNADFNSRRNVRITGEVMYTGVYTILEDNETIASFISRAGGLTNFAHTDGAILYRKFQFVNDEPQEILIPEGDLLDTINNTPAITNLYNLEIIKDLENNNASLVLDTIILIIMLK